MKLATNSDDTGYLLRDSSGIRSETIDRKIELIAPDRLVPYKANARTHTKKQIGQIAESIKRFGFTNPVLIDEAGEIIAGHGRVQAAKLLGLSGVPALRLSHLSIAEKRAYVLADNRLAEKAGWDREILAIELQGLIDLNFDVELTGFETPEIDLIIEEGNEAKGQSPGPEDESPEPVEGPSISQPGDLWVLGKHRVLCGNALDNGAYEHLLQGEKAELVVADPPYNVRIDGNVCGKGAIRHREFAMASGEMSQEAFTEFLTTAFRHLAAHSTDGSIHDICMDWRHIAEMMAAGNQVYTELKNLCVWKKTNAGMGSFYRNQHELVFVWKSGTAPHVNNFELGQHGRNRTNVWEYPGISSMRPGRLEELAMHPTVKPVGLVADAIKDCSRRDGIVLDPFLGSGTTVIAAERTGRRARGIEIDPAYADVAIKRWQTYTGKHARDDRTDFRGDRGGPGGVDWVRSQRRKSHRSSCRGGALMSDFDQKNRADKPVASAPKSSGEDSKTDYHVGYKRPPRDTRFKPGQSGNPKGRPKGTPNHRTTVNRVLNEKVSIREGDKTRRITKFEAMFQAHAQEHESRCSFRRAGHEHHEPDGVSK